MNVRLMTFIALLTSTTVFAQSKVTTLAPGGGAESDTPAFQLGYNEFNATKQKYGIGYETGTTIGVLSRNTVVFSMWRDQLGFDTLLGVTKTENAYTETVTEQNTTSTTPPNSKIINTSHSGTNGLNTPLEVTLGVVPKYRLFQNSWFQMYGGVVAALTYIGSTATKTGTKQETTPDTANATNDRTVIETNLGDIKTNWGLEFAVGPKLGAEFYLKWFPHLAIGFATGMLTTFGGEITRTTTTTTRTYQFTNGVEQPAATSTATSSSLKAKRGIRENTFGIGGTAFSWTGIFTIRYVW